jgi:hypothetical protein
MISVVFPMNCVYIYIELMWAVTSVKRERGEKTPLGLIPN